MAWDLSDGREPDMAVELPARYAAPLVEAVKAVARMMEITSVDGDGPWFGVLVGNEQIYGRLDLAGASIPRPVPLLDFGGHLPLEEQRAIAQRFRRSLGGPVRQALALARHALAQPAVYAVFHDAGMVLAPVSRRIVGRRRLAAVQCRDASSMEEERICVRLNASSADAWRIARDALREREYEEMAGDPTLDDVRRRPPSRRCGRLLADPVRHRRRGGQDRRGDRRPRRSHPPLPAARRRRRMERPPAARRRRRMGRLAASLRSRLRRRHRHGVLGRDGPPRDGRGRTPTTGSGSSRSRRRRTTPSSGTALDPGRGPLARGLDTD